MRTTVPKLQLTFLMLMFCLISVHVSYAQNCGPNKVLICHKGTETICVNKNALQAHLNHGDYLGPCQITCAVTANGGTITCTNSSVKLTATSSVTGVTFSWTGPGGFTSSVQNPTITTAGLYKVTISGQGCTASDTALVKTNTTLPGVVGTGGTLSCTVTSITISATSIAGATYSWSGPSGFTSTVKNPTVTLPGIYTAKATNPANGCISTDTANVKQTGVLPGATASAPSVLTCTTTTVTLTGTSSTAGVSFSWTGPNGFTSTVQNPTTTKPGIYTLTVKNPANGCTSTDTANVKQKIVAPGATATASGVLTCSTSSITLNGASPTTGVSFSWTGPSGFTSAVQNPTVTKPGIYTLTVKNPANGCTSTDTANVLQTTTLPTCSLTLASATNTISTAITPGTTYSWTVAGNPQWTIVSGQGTNSVKFNPGPIGSIGVFTLIATTTASGCVNVCNIVLRNTSNGVILNKSESYTEFLSEQNARGFNDPNFVEPEDKFKMNGYPNPSWGKSVIEFVSPVNDYIQIDVYDFTGSKISMIYKGKVEAGKTSQAVFNGENHPSGTYYYKVSTQKKLYEGKFILMH
jgi:hypothetical protein